MPEVTDAQIVSTIHKMLKQRPDLEKYTFSTFVSELERRLGTIVGSRTRFLTKSIDDHLLQNFGDVSPAEEAADLPVALKVRRPRGQPRSASARSPSRKKRATSKIGKRKEKANKKPRLEGEPKKPRTSYFLFMEDKRGDIIKGAPGMTVSEIGHKMGELWRNLSSEEKEMYEEKAAVLKQQYLKDFAAWKQAHPELPTPHREKPKLQHPKAARPEATPDGSDAYRAAEWEKLKTQHPNLTEKELESKLNEMWAALPGEQKMIYATKTAGVNGKATNKRATNGAKAVPSPPHTKRPAKNATVEDGSDSSSEHSDSGTSSDSDSSSSSSDSSSSSSSESSAPPKPADPATPAAVGRPVDAKPTSPVPPTLPPVAKKATESAAPARAADVKRRKMVADDV